MELALEWGHVWRKGMKKEERKGSKKKQKKTLKQITDKINKDTETIKWKQNRIKKNKLK